MKEDNEIDKLKEFCEINFLRIHDRFDGINEKFDALLNNKLGSGKKIFFDNADLMEITGLSYRSLHYYRTKKRLHPTKNRGRNLYTQEEVNRFIKKELI